MLVQSMGLCRYWNKLGGEGLALSLFFQSLNSDINQHADNRRSYPYLTCGACCSSSTPLLAVCQLWQSCHCVISPDQETNPAKNEYRGKLACFF